MPTSARHDIAPESSPDAEPFSDPLTFPVDINSADEDQLSALPGIGETIARRILDYRTQFGSFERPEELLNVEGIGTGKLEGLLDYITIGG